MIFQPERCEDERIILHRGGRLEPNLSQPAAAAQSEVLCHISIIIPDEPAAQGGEIGQEDNQNNQGTLDHQSCPLID